MEGNWGILVLLVVAVVVYALIRAHGQRDEDGETNAPECAGADGPDGEPGATDLETTKPDGAADGDAIAKGVDMPWDECQQELSEAPPIQECDQVEYNPPDDAEDGPEFEPETETEVEPVPESGHTVNTAIRRKAWQLFRENYRKILPLAGTFVALMAVRMLFKSGVLPIDDHFNVAGFIALIEPLVALGTAYAAVCLWKGEPLRKGVLIHFLQQGRFFPALGLMLINVAFLAFPTIATVGGITLIRLSVARSAPGEGYRAVQLANSLSFIFLILVLCTTVWLMIWLVMAGFAFVRTPKRGAISAIKSGFRTGNQCFGRVVGMLAAVGWPFGAVRIIQSIGAMWSAWLRAPAVQLAVDALILLLILFYGGYFLLSMAGLAERLLPEEGNAPQAESEPPGGDGPREDVLLEERDPVSKAENAEAPPAGNAPEDGTG